MTKITATPAKLRNGNWGARVTGRVSAGSVVTIKTRSGKTWDAQVERVLWTGDGVSLCATRSLDRKPSTSTRRCCEQCGRRSHRLVNAVDMSGIGGLVCTRCANSGHLSFA